MTESNRLNKSGQTRTARVFLKKYWIILVLLLIILIIALLLWRYLSRPESDYLFLSGRLEGYETDISPKYGGKVAYVVGREGKAVNKNELLVKIDDAELRAQLKAAEANLSVSKQQEKQAALQLDILNSQILQAQLNVTQSTGESQGIISQSQANTAAARTQLLQAQGQLVQAQSDLSLAASVYRRYRNLLRTNSISRQEFEQAQTNYNVAVANEQIRRQAVNISQSQIAASQGALTQAQTSALNPSIRSLQVNALQTQLKQARSQLEAARANIKRSLADRQLILAQIAYMNIKSPLNGVILARTTEPGEIVATGKTLLTILDYNTVYLRGYIPEGSIGLVKIGQKARIYLDSYPDKPIPARLAEVDAEAMFTPENIYFRDERVKQVFGVKLSIDNKYGYAKPGMPADAEIYIGNTK